MIGEEIDCRRGEFSWSRIRVERLWAHSSGYENRAFEWFGYRVLLLERISCVPGSSLAFKDKVHNLDPGGCLEKLRTTKSNGFLRTYNKERDSFGIALILGGRLIGAMYSFGDWYLEESVHIMYQCILRDLREAETVFTNGRESSRLALLWQSAALRLKVWRESTDTERAPKSLYFAGGSWTGASGRKTTSRIAVMALSA
jgi:hypothetical protein